MPEAGQSLDTAKRGFLVVRVERQAYAVAAENVVEVIHPPKVARVPQAPAALIGVANLRGVVTPVVSLRNLLGVAESEKAAASRVVVLQIDGLVSLVVDAVDSIVAIEVERIIGDAAPLDGQRTEGAGRAEGGGDVAKILDVRALLAKAFERRAILRRDARSPNPPSIPLQKPVAKREHFVSFEVANQEFALDLSLVKEIISLPDAIAATPHADRAIAGVIAFREQVLPLLSLRELLGFESRADGDEREKILVTSIDGVSLGFIADRARSIIVADPDRIEPAPPIIQSRSGSGRRIKSVYRDEAGKRLVPILAADQLLLENVMQQIGVVAPPARMEGGSEAKQAESKFLIFRLGADEYGLPVAMVDEVANAPERLTRVPKAPKFLEGVINLHGAVIPVIDQRRRFDMPELENKAGRRIVVVRTEKRRAALIVDSVSEVFRAPTDSVKSAPELTEDIGRLLQGVINVPESDRIILILNPDELLTRAERGMLDKFEGAAPASK